MGELATVSNQVQKTPAFGEIDRVLVGGDLSKLNPEQRVSYYNAVCESMGLNPLTKPFDYITLNGKLVLYANKGCAEQLRMSRKISIKVVGRETIEGVYVVTAEASDPEGRTDSATGAVAIAGLKGESLANAFMKCETKAKRRVTLSICGLNMLDESEVESIPQVQTVSATVSNPSREPVQAQVQHQSSVYRVDFGKWEHRTLDEILHAHGREAIVSYLLFLHDSAKKKGQTIDPNGKAGTFIRQAEAFLAELDNVEPPVHEIGWADETEHA